MSLEDIRFVAKAPTDMNLLGNLEEGYVALTEDALLVATGENGAFLLSGETYFETKKQQKKFRKYERENEGAGKLRRIPLEKIRRLCVSVQIRTYTLYYEAAQGADGIVAVYTPACQKEMERLIGECNRLVAQRQETSKDGGDAKEQPFSGRLADAEPNGEQGLPPVRVYQDNREKLLRKQGIFLRVLSYFKPYALLLFVLLLTYLAAAGLNLLWPYLNGTVLYDRVLTKNAAVLEFLHLPAGRFATAMLLVVAAMVLTKLTMLLFEVLQGVVLAQIVPMVVLSMKNRIFKSMGELSLGYFQSSQTGGLMTRVLSDADVVIDFFTTWLPNILTDSFSLVTTCVIMFVLDWRLAIASWILLPLLAFITIRLRTRLHTLFGQRHRSERSLRSKLNDNITGVRVVKSFGQENREISGFHGINEEVRNAEMRIVKYNNQFSAVYTFVQQSVTLLVWSIGGYFVLMQGDITYGLLITFAGYVAQLQQPLRDFSQMFRALAETVSAAERVFEVIDAKPEITEDENPVPVSQMKGEITLNHVTFGYEPNRPVIHDMSLKVPAGRTLGIVGRSGAGKSTLVNLISRLYEVQEGSICIDGVDIRKLPFKDLRRNVAMVSQDTYIFMGTVAENIAYANPEATREEIIRAAILASAHDFICRMPEGYDTVIGASGRTLSGGERQRISIARAILADPRILILDEATASVDTETEKQIQSSLQYLARGRTTLSIAHRLSTLRDADRLIVIEQGRIVEEGTHSELIEKKGTFYLLMELQTKALAMRGLTDNQE